MNKKNKYLTNSSRPTGPNSSVRYGNQTRFSKSEEQARLSPIDILSVIDYVNEFLSSLGISPTSNPIWKNNDFKGNFYKKIKEENNLEDERDIVWLKFTEDGFLGVVATSNDINFDMPKSDRDYNKKHTTSGIIIHHLKKKWNSDFVLIFPLEKIPNQLKRGDIERGIGNYLINNGVPILDYYSHRY